ncbi:hypothetical protein [Confluentibacter lentus]|uniref:hypothetical protein n=1 Tax=Confluentibacter lentus TaxID=1699412 RepID=UPI000C28226D|nr:hypothetical protein [Confluentibacter lentus]
MKEYSAEKKKQILESIHDLLVGFDLYTAKDILYCAEKDLNYNSIIQSRNRPNPSPSGQQQ